MEKINSFIQLLKKRNIKLVIFDFDNTILNTHSTWMVNKNFYNFIDKYGNTSWQTNPYIHIGKSMDYWSNWFLEKPSLDHFTDYGLFITLINKLKQNDINVGIASFGHKIIIKIYVELLLGKNQKIFSQKNVTTPSDFIKINYEFREYNSRNDVGNYAMRVNDHTTALMDKTNQIKLLSKRFNINPTNTILFDDNIINIENCLLTKSYGVCCKNGLNYESIENANRLLSKLSNKFK